jgi:hypothetical protein
MAYLDNEGLEYFFEQLKEIFAPLLETQELKEKVTALETKVTALETALGGLSFTVSSSVPTTNDEKKITFVKGV